MFYANFIRICADSGIKPTPLLQQLNISKGNLSKWRDGAIPNGATLSKISSALNVSISDLLGEGKTNPPSPSSDSEDTKYHELMSLIDRMDDDTLARFLELAHLASLPKADYDRAMAILRLALPNDQS